MSVFYNEILNRRNYLKKTKEIDRMKVANEISETIHQTKLAFKLKNHRKRMVTVLKEKNIQKIKDAQSLSLH